MLYSHFQVTDAKEEKKKIHKQMRNPSVEECAQGLVPNLSRLFFFTFEFIGAQEL